MIDLVNNQRETEIRRNIYIFLRELAASGPIVGDFSGGRFCRTVFQRRR